MDVSRKRVNTRDSDKFQSAESSKRRRGNLNSELDGKYWQRASSRRKLGLGSRLHKGTPEGSVEPSTSLIIRPVFDVGLPIVFGEHRAQ
jgi:hypothetical protein